MHAAVQVGCVLATLLVARIGTGIARVAYLKATGSPKSPPRITLLGRVVNWAFWLPGLLRLHPFLEWPIDLKKLQKEAQKRARSPAGVKLTEWAAPEEGSSRMDYRKGYGYSIELLNQRPLSSFGKFACFDYLMRRLIARLKVVDAVAEAGGEKKLAELAPVKSPVFVLGLPRTGTTFLHRLLSLDPEVQYPRTFELLDTVGATNKKTGKPVSRGKQVAYWQEKLDLIKRIVPQVEVMHELGAEEAEECLLSMGVDVPILPCTFHVLVQHPEEVFNWDISGTYEHHRNQLSLLSRRNGTEGKRWVLKCPVHLGYVRDLAKVFPDAKVVWTHRDPCSSLPSLASLFRAFTEMFEGQDIDLHALGREQLKFWAEALKRAHTDVGSCGVEHAHVKYAELVKDPIAAVKKLYKGFGWAVSAEFEANMKEYLAKNAAKREASSARLKKFHAYSLDEYGLTAAEVKQTLKWYYDQYEM